MQMSFTGGVCADTSTCYWCEGNVYPEVRTVVARPCRHRKHRVVRRHTLEVLVLVGAAELARHAIAAHGRHRGFLLLEKPLVALDLLALRTRGRGVSRVDMTHAVPVALAERHSSHKATALV